MKKINLASDRVRLPSNAAWFPTQLDRALTKLKFPFSWLQQCIPTGPAKYSRGFRGPRTKQQNYFCRNFTNGRRRGAVETTDDSTMLTGHWPDRKGALNLHMSPGHEPSLTVGLVPGVR